MAFMAATVMVGLSSMRISVWERAAEAVPTDFSRIRLLRNGLWTPAFRPFDPDRSFSGVNLAESFGEAYAAGQDTEVGFITCVEEYEKMLNAEAIAKAGDAIAQGVLDYYAAQAKWVK